MTPCCHGCGGPLFRRACLGYCTLRMVSRGIRRPAPPGQPTQSGGYEIAWLPSFTSDTGQPLSVARWIAYNVTPNGHQVRVWPAIARRMAA